MKTARRFSLLAVFLLALCPAVRADDAKPAPTAPAQPATFIYVLRLVERLHDDNAWTDADKQAVGAHFNRLKEDTARGKVIFAGRTMEDGAHTFGIVVFEAKDQADAETYANADPAVTGGAMRVDTHPFAVVLQRK